MHSETVSFMNNPLVTATREREGMTDIVSGDQEKGQKPHTVSVSSTEMSLHHPTGNGEQAWRTRVLGRQTTHRLCTQVQQYLSRAVENIPDSWMELASSVTARPRTPYLLSAVLLEVAADFSSKF